MTKQPAVRFLFLVFSLMAGQSVYAADLKMRIVWEGELPEVKMIDKADSKECRGVNLNLDRQFIDAETKGVRHAVVYVAPPRGERERWRQPHRKETIRIDVCHCRIQPHISIAQTGDRLKVDESDGSTGHNLNFLFFENAPIGPNVVAIAEHLRDLVASEPAPIPIECNVHPWERGYLFVLDHTFIGKSGNAGNLVIRGLPADSDVPLRMFHELGSIHSVIIGGERRQLERGRFNVRVSGAMTDLGKVVIDAQSFAKSDSEDR